MDSRCLLALIAAAALSGCGGTPVANGSANAAAPAAGLKEQPVKEEHRALSLTPAWLAGRWQTEDGGDCGAGDTFFTLEPNGQYTFMEEKGRWSLTGDRLTIEVTEASEDGGSKPGDRNTNQVVPIGPNEAEFRTAGGPAIRVFRCHGE
jgi:hypothetical protein